MKTEETGWVEMGRYWVPEPARQRQQSLEMRQLKTRIIEENGRAQRFVLQVPTAQQKAAQEALDELYPTKEADYRRHREGAQTLKQKGQQKLVLGAILTALGLVLSLGSFFAADQWQMILLYGAILSGLFLMLTGWLQKK